MTRGTPQAGQVRLTRLESGLLTLIGAGERNGQISEHETVRGREMSEKPASRTVGGIRDAFGARTRCHLISMLHDLGYGKRTCGRRKPDA